jgi:hypothetical protein
MLRDSHPGDTVAPNLDNGTTNIFHELQLVSCTKERLVAAAEGLQGAVHLGERLPPPQSFPFAALDQKEKEPGRCKDEEGVVDGLDTFVEIGLVGLHGGEEARQHAPRHADDGIHDRDIERREPSFARSFHALPRL